VGAAKERLDLLLVARGLAESREQAQRLIGAGQVRVAGQAALKAAQRVAVNADLAVAERPRFVSRGGEKLEAALAHFALEARGRVCADIGASTGGFTDCLLQRGAARVYAVDVGRGQLHWRLRRDPRVICREGVNARYLDRAVIPEPLELSAVDVSFISLTNVLPAVIRLLGAGADLVALIKPQFEAGRGQVGKGGVVRDPAVRAQTVERLRRFGAAIAGLEWRGVCESPLKGPAGNVEFLACWHWSGGESGGAER